MFGRTKAKIQELESELVSLKWQHEEIVNTHKATNGFLQKIIDMHKKQDEINRSVILSQEQEIEELKARISQLESENAMYRATYGERIVVDEFNAAAIGSKCASGAWNCGQSKAELQIGSFTVVFEGTVYDNAYESYTADCDVTIIDANGNRRTVREVGSHCTGPYRVETYEHVTWDDVSREIAALGETGTIKFL